MTLLESWPPTVRRMVSEGERVESIENIAAHLISEIQALQFVLGESAEPDGTIPAKWVIEQLDKVLTVQLPDGREYYLGTRTSEPQDYGTL
jgi:hypothetical protein